jgi:hypothetical protein
MSDKVRMSDASTDDPWTTFHLSLAWFGSKGRTSPGSIGPVVANIAP